MAVAPDSRGVSSSASPDSESFLPDREATPSPGPGGGDSQAFRVDYAPLFAGSPRMRTLLDDIRQVADTNATVLVQGESGVSYKTLLYKIDQCGLARKRSRPAADSAPDLADSA